MNKRIRTGIIIAVLGIGLVAVGVVVLSRIVSQLLAPVPQPVAPQILTEAVVVTTHDIPMGAPLSMEDVKTVDMPVELIPRDAIREVGSVVGRMARTTLISGEMVLNHDLADPDNITHDLAYELDDSLVLMAFPATDIMSNLNIIQRGDIVDIMVSLQQAAPVIEAGSEGEQATDPEGDELEQTVLFTFYAMQRVGITAMVIDIIVAQDQGTIDLSAEGDGAVPTPGPDEYDVQAYLLAVTPQDALVLKHLMDAGGQFDLVLRAPTSLELFDVRPVIPEYLIERYELEIPE